MHRLFQFILFISLQVASCVIGQLTYSRGDETAYLKAGGTFDGSSYHTQSIDKGISPTNQFTYDDQIPCTIYLAESSIPNSGLGMYTSIPLNEGDSIGHSEIRILNQDPLNHNPQREWEFNLLTSYVWSSTSLTNGEYEVANGEAVCPGVGMAANCHYRLVNVGFGGPPSNSLTQMDGSDSQSIEAGQHTTMDDVGRGSFSWHSDVRYQSLKALQAGEELFVNYGPEWYEQAEKKYGYNIPSKEHFEEADDILQTFVQEHGYDEQKYDALLFNDMRLQATLPDNIRDVAAAIEMGTARFSAKDSIRSPEWLSENGACLDTIVGGKSTITQAGQGAFAIKSIARGDVISTTPLITLDKEHLKIFDDVIQSDGTTARLHVGYQLLLNYCFGHPDSSLVLYPFSPVVNFVNHGSKQFANAKIRWSTSPNHKTEWLNSTLEETKRRDKSGLMFDIVATKNIARGDEILLYYGDSWAQKWQVHITNWETASKNLTNLLSVQTAAGFQGGQTLTVDEREDVPLPEHIMTRCAFAMPSETDNAKAYNSKKFKYAPCDILDANLIEGTDRHMYTTKIEYTVPDTNEVMLYSVKYDSASDFLRYTERPYSRDQFGVGVFRQNIELSDGIFPSHWLDLKSDN